MGDHEILSTFASALTFLSKSWEVLLLFLIPIGGGIPAGVLLARNSGLSWVIMMILYFISDVILAFLFEPLMMLTIALGKRFSSISWVATLLKKSTERTTSRYGTSLGPLSLVFISFGVDPMTGRAAAAAAGHGFLSGWILAIAGDMIYFTVLMISTLWLNTALGDDTKTTVFILVLMAVLPPLFNRLFRKKRRESPLSAEVSGKKSAESKSSTVNIFN